MIKERDVFYLHHSKGFIFYMGKSAPLCFTDEKKSHFEIKEITRKKSVQEVLKQYLLTTDSALIKLKS